MKISRIELNNFGSYEGHNIFNLVEHNNAGKITVIGGKNGAGKTTLFSGIKICLYGHKESGYQAINAWYKNKIKKLINDKSKLENDARAFVLLELSIFNGQDWDLYTLKRAWDLEEDAFEVYTVNRNGVSLTEDEIIDFENFLLNLIPPELFDLYFFDGEQIADFFLNESNGGRIKNAFLTICGYDTFDILYKNFKRISRGVEVDNKALNDYFAKEDDLYKSQNQLDSIKAEIKKLSEQIELIDTELTGIEKKFISGGGVSIEEWNNKFLDLKNEERLREEKNAWLKNAANDIIPYIILNEQIKNLLNQMNAEKDMEKAMVLIDATSKLIPETLDNIQKKHSDFSDDFKKEIMSEIIKKVKQDSPQGEIILNLSKDEYNTLLRATSAILNYKAVEVINAKKEIQDSIKRSQERRNDIEASNITEVDSYLKKKEELISQKLIHIDKINICYDNEKNIEKQVEKNMSAYKQAEKALEKYLKNESLSDLTTRSIVFLDALQKRLFSAEIEKVKVLFMSKMNQLMRKDDFICDIAIDDDFTVHVYKRIQVDSKGVCDRISQTSISDYINEYGTKHCNDILSVTSCDSLEDFVSRFSGKNEVFDVVVEFDKSTMSKGEKQVFIMALYWSIMQLCNKEIPFIIDTPFARIDTEHRAHITKYFFKELKGQVIIFSTNEEITSEHMNVIGCDLQSKFLIENIDNRRTLIQANTYFGE